MNEKQVKEFLEENLLTKREAMDITGQSLSAFDQAVNTGRLVPFFERGKARGIVRLYLKKDVEEYNKERIKHLKERNLK